MCASVLERLSGPLCDAALTAPVSATVLADLDRANLFVVPLDQRRVWYRCHRLFRDALRVQLESETAASILSRAADWFVAQGLVEDAISLKIEARILEVRWPACSRRAVPWFLEHGAGSHRAPGRPARILMPSESDPTLCGSLGWAAAVAGQFRPDRTVA